MIQIRVDGKLAFDSRIPDMALSVLKVKTGTEIGGTATVAMPKGHPAYDLYCAYGSLVEVYKNGTLLFRGRPISPTDDFYGTRTVTCEGERCFLRDSLQRPYNWELPPSVIFHTLLEEHNRQVLPDRRFTVGTIEVANEEPLIFSSEKAERTDAVLDNLIKLCGGYIRFSGDRDKRYIHWVPALSDTTEQTVELGKNLLDMSIATENADLATVIVPYGAKDEETGKPVTVASINGGLDYIEDEAASALRGRIVRAVEYSEIIDPQQLLDKAREELSARKLLISSLTVKAVDLSDLFLDTDMLTPGRQVRVVSPAHGVDEYFLLTEREYNLLNPGGDTITFGKSVPSLTRDGAAGEKQSLQVLRSSEAGQKTTAKVAAAQLVENVLKAGSSEEPGTWKLPHGPRMQWGVVNVSTAAANTPVATELAFPTPFSSAPTMLLTAQHTDPASVALSVGSVYASGAEIRLSSKTGSETVQVFWAAIGPG